MSCPTHYGCGGRYAEEKAAPRADWIAFTDPLEVLPRGDLREHTFGRKCWCKPFEEDGVIVHNSMDGRERFERQERKAS